MKRALQMILGLVLLFGAAMFWLWWSVFYSWLAGTFIAGREIYHSAIPFLIGGVVAVTVVLWPIRKRLSGWKADIGRAATFTICLTPVPFGPEAGLVPMGLLFPFALMAWQGPVIIFGGTFCLSSGLRMLANAIKNSIEAAEPTSAGDVATRAAPEK